MFSVAKSLNLAAFLFVTVLSKRPKIQIHAKGHQVLTQADLFFVCPDVNCITPMTKGETECIHTYVYIVFYRKMQTLNCCETIGITFVHI